ncbi:MAG: NAD(P)-dependent oxidoreductase [Sphingobium sp.]
MATPATRHIVDTDSLSTARGGIHIINVARGSLIDQQALLAALDSGQAGLPAPDLGTNILSYFIANLDRFRQGLGLNGLVEPVVATEEATA